MYLLKAVTFKSLGKVKFNKAGEETLKWHRIAKHNKIY